MSDRRSEKYRVYPEDSGTDFSEALYLYTRLYGVTSLTAVVTTSRAPHNFLPAELQYSRPAAISHDSTDSQNPIFPRDTTNSSSLKYPTGGRDVLPRYLLNCLNNVDGTSLPGSYNSVIKKKYLPFQEHQ